MTVALALLGKVLGSAGMGTIVGLFGSWLQKRQDLKQLEMELDHQLKMREADRELKKLEIAGASQIAAFGLEETKELAAAEALAASLAADKRAYSVGVDSKLSWLLVAIDFLRGTVRPVVTYYLVGFLSWMVWVFLKDIPLVDLRTLNPELFWTVFEYTLTTAVFLAATAVAWWFGARAKKLN